MGGSEPTQQRQYSPWKRKHRETSTDYLIQWLSPTLMHPRSSGFPSNKHVYHQSRDHQSITRRGILPGRWNFTQSCSWGRGNAGNLILSTIESHESCFNQETITRRGIFLFRWHFHDYTYKTLDLLVCRAVESMRQKEHRDEHGVFSVRG